MSDTALQEKLIHFPPYQKKRKRGINARRKGSVRNINGKVWFDFRYIGERVRESSGLTWNKVNIRKARRR